MGDGGHGRMVYDGTPNLRAQDCAYYATRRPMGTLPLPYTSELRPLDFIKRKPQNGLKSAENFVGGEIISSQSGD